MKIIRECICMKKVGESNIIQELEKILGYKINTKILSDADIAEIKEYAKLDDLTTDAIMNNKFDAKSYLDNIRTCMACTNATECQASIRGYVPVMDSSAHIAYRPCNRYEAYRKNQKIADMLGDANIPPVYQSMSFETFDINRINGGKWLVNRAKGVLSHGNDKTANTGQKQPLKPGIYFTGDPGIGKTHLAVSTLKLWIAAGRAGAFATVPILLQSLRKGYEQKDYDERIELLCSVPLLILDDFGTERPNPWATEQLFTIINARYTGGKATIFTSNLSIEQMEGRLGEMGIRISSRIMGMCDVVTMSGKDKRIYD